MFEKNFFSFFFVLKRSICSIREKNNEEVIPHECTLLKDKVKRLPFAKVANKAKSLDLVMGKGGELRVNTFLVRYSL